MIEPIESETTGPPAPPEDLRTAQQLWWVIVALGIVGLIAAVPGLLADRAAFTTDFHEQMRESDPAVTRDLAEAAVWVGLTLGAILGVVLAGLTVLFAHLMVKGKLWARVLLNIGAAWFIVSGVAVLFSVGEMAGAGAMVSGAASIVQGVSAAGAVFLSHRRACNEYFLQLRR